MGYLDEKGFSISAADGENRGPPLHSRQEVIGGEEESSVAVQGASFAEASELRSRAATAVSLTLSSSVPLESLSGASVEDTSGDRSMAGHASIGVCGDGYPSERGRSISASLGGVLMRRRRSIFRGNEKENIFVFSVTCKKSETPKNKNIFSLLSLLFICLIRTPIVSPVTSDGKNFLTEISLFRKIYNIYVQKLQ